MNKNDDMLARAVIRELGEEDTLSSTTIAIAVKDGIVRLLGKVHSREDRHDAEAAVRRVRGVRDVIDELELERS